MAKSFSLPFRKGNFFYEKFFLKAFLCTRIMQFWLARLISFARKLITFSSVLATDKKNICFFPKILIFVKVFFWTLIKHFWQTLQKLLDRRLKYFCSVFFKKMFCRNYKSHQNNPMDTKNGFEDLAKKFSSRHRKIFAQCLKITEMVFFRHFLDFFHTTKTFLWTIRMQFSQHRRKMFAR